MIRFWWSWPYFQGHYIINTCTQKVSYVCTLSFFLHILISIITNLNTFCINVHIHEMLLLHKKKGQGINTVIVIPLCNFLMSVTLLFFLCILLNNFRNLVLLEFGDLDFIFKVGNLNFDRKKFYALCRGYRISAAYWQFSFFLFFHENMLWHLGKILLMSTHNICFHGEMWKIPMLFR